MKRDDLAHIIRAASAVTEDGRILVIGSQAILAAFPEDDLPPEATISIEADVAFFDDPDELKADQVDGAIGEASPFHYEFGYYGQGVSITTATLPSGWESRVLPFQVGDTGQAEAFCLEPHDLTLAKLVAGREKDLEFADSLIRRGHVNADTLLERLENVEVVGAVKRRIETFIRRRM